MSSRIGKCLIHIVEHRDFALEVPLSAEILLKNSARAVPWVSARDGNLLTEAAAV